MAETDNEIRGRLSAGALSGMEQWHTQSDRARAKRYYFGKSSNIEAPQEELSGFLQWYVHDFRDSKGRTLMERYFDTHAGELTPRELELLTALRDSWPGVFEVEEVEEGRGIHLRGVTSGVTIFVHDVTASRQMVRGDWILSRIEELDGMLNFVSDGFTVPPAVRGEFLKWIEAEARAASLTPEEFVRSRGNRLYREIRTLSDEWLQNLQIVNREGGLLEFCSSEYTILDEPTLLSTLRSLEELHEEQGEPGEVHFAWLAPVAASQRAVYGQVLVSGGILRLEAQSRTRLQLGRGLLETHAGRLLQHRNDSSVSLDEFKQMVASSSGPVMERPIPPEDERAIILRMKAEHYAAWPDHPLPALGGKSPRRAVRSKAGRTAVLKLIRDMENLEAREAKEGRPAFDFTPLRKTLGL